MLLSNENIGTLIKCGSIACKRMAWKWLDRFITITAGQRPPSTPYDAHGVTQLCLYHQFVRKAYSSLRHHLRGLLRLHLAVSGHQYKYTSFYIPSANKIRRNARKIGNSENTESTHFCGVFVSTYNNEHSWSDRWSDQLINNNNIEQFLYCS